MADPLRFVLVGAGSVARAHARHWAAVPGCHIVAVIDADRPRAETFVTELELTDIEVATSLDDVPADAVDVVDICTPPGPRAQLAMTALERGHHVVLEKPIARDLREFDRIAAAAVAADRLVLPVFQNRHGAGVEALERVIAADLTGRFLHGLIEMSWDRDASYWCDSWHGEPTMSAGGQWAQLAIHPLDLALRFTPPVIKVVGLATRQVHPVPVDTAGAAIVSCADGSFLTVSATTEAHAQVSQGLLVFEHCQVRFGPAAYDYASDHWRIVSDEKAIQAKIDDVLRSIPPEEPVAGDLSQPWLALCQTVYRILRKQQSPEGHDLASGRAAHEIVAAIMRSAAEGCAITLPLATDADPHPFTPRLSPEELDRTPPLEGDALDNSRATTVKTSLLADAMPPAEQPLSPDQASSAPPETEDETA